MTDARMLQNRCSKSHAFHIIQMTLLNGCRGSYGGIRANENRVLSQCHYWQSREYADQQIGETEVLHLRLKPAMENFCFDKTIEIRTFLFTVTALYHF